jgi:hypothetical protein
VLERLALERSTAHKAVQRLAASATIEADGRRQRVVDPLFAEWVGRLAGDGGEA